MEVRPLLAVPVDPEALADPVSAGEAVEGGASVSWTGTAPVSDWVWGAGTTATGWGVGWAVTR